MTAKYAARGHGAGPSAAAGISGTHGRSGPGLSKRPAHCMGLGGRRTESKQVQGAVVGAQFKMRNDGTGCNIRSERAKVYQKHIISSILFVVILAHNLEDLSLVQCLAGKARLLPISALWRLTLCIPSQTRIDWPNTQDTQSQAYLDAPQDTPAQSNPLAPCARREPRFANNHSRAMPRLQIVLLLLVHHSQIQRRVGIISHKISYSSPKIIVQEMDANDSPSPVNSTIHYQFRIPVLITQADIRLARFRL
jgi:hypothetical protein